MKNFVLGLVVVFLVASVSGCGKKKEEAMSMEGLNGVTTENVVSVSDANTNGVAVVVDNAQAMLSDAMAPIEDGSAVDAVTGRPSGKQIQQALKHAGFYSGKIDGDVGPRTKKAIEAFQSANGLKADGKVGPRTWKALAAHLNKVPEVTNPSAEAQTVGQ